MAEDEPEVPILCPECETETRIVLSELADSIDRHNDQMHDGEEIARVDPDVSDQLADLVARDMDLL